MAATSVTRPSLPTTSETRRDDRCSPDARSCERRPRPARRRPRAGRRSATTRTRRSGARPPPNRSQFLSWPTGLRDRRHEPRRHVRPRRRRTPLVDGRRTADHGRRGRPSPLPSRRRREAVSSRSTRLREPSGGALRRGRPRALSPRPTTASTPCRTGWSRSTRPTDRFGGRSTGSGTPRPAPQRPATTPLLSADRSCTPTGARSGRSRPPTGSAGGGGLPRNGCWSGGPDALAPATVDDTPTVLVEGVFPQTGVGLAAPTGDLRWTASLGADARVAGFYAAAGGVLVTSGTGTGSDGFGTVVVLDEQGREHQETRFDAPVTRTAGAADRFVVVTAVGDAAGLNPNAVGERRWTASFDRPPLVATDGARGLVQTHDGRLWALADG